MLRIKSTIYLTGQVNNKSQIPNDKRERDNGKKQKAERKKENGRMGEKENGRLETRNKNQFVKFV